MAEKAHLVIDQKDQARQANHMTLLVMSHIRACLTRSSQDDYEEE